MTLLQIASNIKVESHKPTLAERLLARMGTIRDREIDRIHQKCNEHALYWCFCVACRRYYYKLAVMNREFGPNTIEKDHNQILDTYKYAV